MATIAIDTAFECCSIALRTQKGRVWQETVPSGPGQADELIASLARGTSTLGLDAALIATIVYSAGPGGFTGLRAGLAMLQGLQAVSRARTFAVTSLQAIALTALRQHRGALPAVGAPLLRVLVDAKRGDVFEQTFDTTGRSLGDCRCLGRDEAADRLANFDGMVIASGTGAVSDRLSCELDMRVGGGGCLFNVPAEAADLLDVPGLGLVDEGSRIRPLYLRAPDAAPARPLLVRTGPLPAEGLPMETSGRNPSKGSAR